MGSRGIDALIVNSPYVEPSRYWRYDSTTKLFDLIAGRRPAGYVRASTASLKADDPGIFIELPLVNKIRPRIAEWRLAGYPGVTGVTKRLLDHWRDSEQRPDYRFFFCQLEAIETLIWLAEAPNADRVGIDVPGDGGEFRRLCAKLATGAGKTIIMAMLIAWQVLNKVAYPQDTRFSKNVLVLAPGLTVKSRLHVLYPALPGNYYDLFDVVPSGLRDGMNQAKVQVHNWHRLLPLDPDAGPKVMKKGPESDEAFTRRVLEEMASSRNFIVINDEAHHAWRVPPKSTVRGVAKDEIEQATQWIGGLDRLDKTRGILTCYDLTATPFAPTGRQSGDETLFDWIVSDFGLNDAIESGLVKTPRVVIRDDGRLGPDYKSRLFHIYADPDVKDDFNRRALEHEPLPDLVRNGYYLLGTDWLETMERWEKSGAPTRPVMITVANRTETAGRVYYAFTHGKILIDALNAPDRTLRIDSKVLALAEERDDNPDAIATEVVEGDADDDAVSEARPRKQSKVEQAETLRRTVDTVGRVGQPGEAIQNVISVAMLSEGWDAKTVTHIMGLRAFTSQLLCEQVVGRGLRRTSYDVNPTTGLFEPEYVNIFGVPFTFLPHEEGDGSPPLPALPRARVEPDPAKLQFEVSWPNVIRIDREYRPRLTLDTLKMKPLILDATSTPTLAELAPIIAGKPDMERATQIDLEDLGSRFRLQTIVFRSASEIFDQVRTTWKGDRATLIAQLVAIVDRVLKSDLVTISPQLVNHDSLRRRVVLAINMNKIVQHVSDAIQVANTEALVPVFDSHFPIRSTGDMFPWFTGKPCSRAVRSHINLCVFDSTWEASEAFVLDNDPHVKAWVRNDHLGFEIHYVFGGVVRKYRPDFLIRLTDGTTLVLEVKGQESSESKTKRTFLDEWVRAINGHGGFGFWAGDVSRDPADIRSILTRHRRPA